MKKYIIMSNKRVYTQKDLSNMFGVERKRIRHLMYNNGIGIKNQYCPFRGITKSGYLLNVNDLPDYAKELSLEKDKEKKYYVAVKNNSLGCYFFNRIGEDEIFNIGEGNTLFALIETNLIDINSALNNELENFPSVDEDFLTMGFTLLGIKYSKFS